MSSSLTFAIASLPALASVSLPAGSLRFYSRVHFLTLVISHDCFTMTRYFFCGNLESVIWSYCSLKEDHQPDACSVPVLGWGWCCCGIIGMVAWQVVMLGNANWPCNRQRRSSLKMHCSFLNHLSYPFAMTSVTSCSCIVVVHCHYWNSSH